MLIEVQKQPAEKTPESESMGLLTNFDTSHTCDGKNG